MSDLIRWLEEVDNEDVPPVGGKNASLGEMVGALKDRGVRVPDGFATTADAYRSFIRYNNLEGTISENLRALHDGELALEEAGKRIRSSVMDGTIPDAIAAAVRDAYTELCRRYDDDAVDVASRSSATAEDLPEASFAGQQESFLNVRGADDVINACRSCLTSAILPS